MVDKDSIMQILKAYFVYEGIPHIDDKGFINCTGDVMFLGKPGQLPVKFGKVDGSFLINSRGLKSLHGSPHTVGHRFICWNNPLTSWQGAPKKVGADVYARSCQLTNLIGAPECMTLFVQDNRLKSLEGMPPNLKQFGFTYDPHLPILRALQSEQIKMYVPDKQGSTCANILNKYAGQGRPGALKAAAELIRAGYVENARW